MIRGLVVATTLFLTACGTPQTARLATGALTLPPMNTFTRAAPGRTPQSNATLARDFLNLTFTLENGQTLPVFTRFEGPIAVRVLGRAPQSLTRDLDSLLDRLRREARIDIQRVTENTDAQITVQPVTRAQIQRVAPSAACFVRPNVSNWQEYRARRNDPETFWNRLTERRKMAIFLPLDVSPQEIRDCLHEEIAQSLGPVNDLYRLTQSVFNDDNFHTVLTSFDMLILRATYDEALSSGMRPADVSNRLPEILARINPRGGRSNIASIRPTNPEWQKSITQATNPGENRGRRITAARRAVALAGGFGATDTRLAYSHYVLGRLSLSRNPDQALGNFLAAGKIYQNRPDTAIHEAHVAMQIAAFQLSAGRAEVALGLVNRNLEVVTQSEHAALLSLLLLIKAEALAILDRPIQSAEAQNDALAWARYGFGNEADIRARVSEIRAISPRTRQDNPT
ncbi:MAG: DUF2927 domain-containing protein [Boseongicola sp.]|nr:DUF2927 domain-containing protein [Boseongicola sp.]